MQTTTRTIGRAARGFSLLELTLVLAIIGILMAIAAVSIFGQGEKAKIKATWATLNVVKNAIDQYNLNNSMYPPALQALQMGKNPYLDPNKPLEDAWGRALLYAVPGQGKPFELMSKGGDNQLGTPDDVTVWQKPKEE